jgi:acetolactate synthase I/III small subunit
VRERGSNPNKGSPGKYRLLRANVNRERSPSVGIAFVGPTRGRETPSGLNQPEITNYTPQRSFRERLHVSGLALSSSLRLSPHLWHPMRHVLSATVQNVPGVLAHISGMLASRGYNIDSLAVGETEDPLFSRMTFVLRGDNRVLDQVRRQLEKIVTVVQVDDISSRNFVERDLMLLKVAAEAGISRTEVKELAEIFRGRIVDVATDSVIVEISGTEKKLEGFIELMRPHGILELVRTGRIAMVRGSPLTCELSDDTTAARPADAGAESLA